MTIVQPAIVEPVFYGEATKPSTFNRECSSRMGENRENVTDVHGTVLKLGDKVRKVQSEPLPQFRTMIIAGTDIGTVIGFEHGWSSDYHTYFLPVVQWQTVVRQSVTSPDNPPLTSPAFKSTSHSLEIIMDHSATIQGMAETIVRLSIEQQEAFDAVKDTRAYIATAQRELHKFETRALKCKTLRGQSNNRALAEYQRGVVTMGEKRLADLHDTIQHNASELIRFDTMIAELRRGLTRRSALCDAPCTDEAQCGACTALEGMDAGFHETESEEPVEPVCGSCGGTIVHSTDDDVSLSPCEGYCSVCMLVYAYCITGCRCETL